MSIKTVATNRKAYHDYSIQDTIEAGISLTGTEIKSVRAGRVSLAQAYVKPENREIWLLNAHIARYEAASYLSHEPTRPRKLLLHKKEIINLNSKIAEKGFTLVPLRLYIKGR
ncbi:SsrA-binding protein SmpB, partial [Chloroflexota bacterium]